MEETLKVLRGVLDVKVKLLENNFGEAEVLYNPNEFALANLKKAVHGASGERHNFMVIGASEDS